ncbi:hypothetical protein ACSFA8_27100 [Variovorax sp. RT4R15]|uniref:hypothetical protein n=1 Tax=Variovorax sp. RT4R15 TaxID=3443737 RepID=UPI003F4487C3
MPPIEEPQKHEHHAGQLRVEKHFAAWHHASRYTERMVLREKPCPRHDEVGGHESEGVHLSARIVLEAKRLLAHTELSVSDIAESIALNDLSNFVKFFNRRPNARRWSFAVDKCLSVAALKRKGAFDLRTATSVEWIVLLR